MLTFQNVYNDNTLKVYIYNILNYLENQNILLLRYTVIMRLFPLSLNEGTPFLNVSKMTKMLFKQVEILDPDVRCHIIQGFVVK